MSVKNELYGGFLASIICNTSCFYNLINEYDTDIDRIKK
jgi:hypothetical protein